MVARMQKTTWGQEPVPVSSDSEMYSSEDSSSEDRSGYLDVNLSQMNTKYPDEYWTGLALIGIYDSGKISRYLW